VLSLCEEEIYTGAGLRNDENRPRPGQMMWEDLLAVDRRKKLDGPDSFNSASDMADIQTNPGAVEV
jgi:hypothetical protein